MNVNAFNFDISQEEYSKLEIKDSENISYEELRQRCIDDFALLYRDDLAFDLNCVPKKTRIRLSEDPVYKMKTKAVLAKMYGEQIHTLQDIKNIPLVSEDGKDNTRTILSALQQQNDLIFKNLADADDSSRINITFMAMTKEDFLADDNVDVFIGTKTDAQLSGGQTVSEEEKLKEKAKEILEREVEQ